MKSTSFKETNVVYEPGNNPNTDQLAACLSTHPEYHDGKLPFIISKFKLDEQELERINETGCIWLSVMGSQMVPVMLMVHHPFDYYKFEPMEMKP